MSGPIGGLNASTFDIETFPNFSMLGVLDIATGAVRQFTTEPGLGETFAQFRAWFHTERHERLWIGFNSIAYDNWMVQAMLQGEDNPAALYALSVSTISNNDWQHKLESVNGEVGIDLLAMHGGKNAKLGSLKEIGVKVGYHTLQELPYPFDHVLNRDEMVEVMNYNVHDLNITGIAALVSEQDIAMRVELSAEIGVRVVNKHAAGLAESVMAHRLFGSGKKMYPNATSWKLHGRDLVKPFQFADPALVALKDRMSHWDMAMQVVEEIDGGETIKRIDGVHFSEAVLIGGKAYTIGHGGLHSVDEAGVFESDERFAIWDFDFASYYPAVIINHGLAPQHLPPREFLAEFAALRTRRLAAKKAGRDTLANGLKIAINSLFGKTGSAYGWLTDPTALIKCTVFGQLTLLMFVDLLQVDGVDVISANTDGITFRVRRDVEADVLEACRELARQLGYDLDWVQYLKVARANINNYVAIRADGKLKTKGAYHYDPAELGKKATNRIAIAAAQRFFAEGVPVAETVEACRDLAQFIDYFRCSKPYQIIDGAGVEHGKIARWYLGTEGVHLDKRRIADGQLTQQVDRGAMLVNNLPEVFPSDVDVARYVGMAEKLVLAITDPEIKFTTTIPRAEWSKAQCETQQTNYETLAPDPERCATIDLTQAMTDWTGRIKGSGYDTMKHLLVKLWMGQGGTMTRGDLLWAAEQLDAADGYFAGTMRRTLTRMIEWVARDVSPFRLPQTTEEVAERAIVWAKEKVEPLKRQRKLQHKDVLASGFLNGDALRRYGKTGDDYKLACSIAAAGTKHGIDITVEGVCDIIADVRKYFSKDNSQHGTGHALHSAI